MIKVILNKYIHNPRNLNIINPNIISPVIIIGIPSIENLFRRIFAFNNERAILLSGVGSAASIACINQIMNNDFNAYKAMKFIMASSIF